MKKGNSDPWGCNNLQLFFPYPGSHLMPPCCCLLHSNEVETSECIHHSAPAPLYIHMHVHAYACQHMGVHMCARTHTHTRLSLYALCQDRIDGDEQKRQEKTQADN